MQKTRTLQFEGGSFESNMYKWFPFVPSFVRGDFSVVIGHSGSLTGSFLYKGSYKNGKRVTIPFQQEQLGHFSGRVGFQQISLSLSLPMTDTILRGIYKSVNPADSGEISLPLAITDIDPYQGIPYFILSC